MPLNEQVIPVNFSAGIDSKTDPKAVVAGKFLRLENGIFTNPNRITKRNGYTALGTSTTPDLVHGYGNELIKADSGVISTWSSSQSAWISRSNYTSIDLSRDLISLSSLFAQTGQPSGLSDVAILTNYALYGWSDQSGNLYSLVKDLSTNSVLSFFTLHTGGSPVRQAVRCVVLGGTTLCVLYYEGDNNRWVARTVTISGGIVTYSAGTVITSNFRTQGCFDIVDTATGAAFIYPETSGNDIVVATLSTSLVVATSTIATTTGAWVNVHINKTSNNNLWAYWTESTDDGAGNLTALTIYYAVFSSTLVPVLARTSIGAQASPYYVSNMISKSDSATQQTLYYGLFKTDNNGAKHELEYTNYITATDSGTVGSATLLANGVTPISRSFTYNSKIYSVFYYRSSDINVDTAVSSNANGSLASAVQPTFFILELTNLQSPPYVVARFAAGDASSYQGYYIRLRTPSNVALFGSSKFYFACGLSTQINPNPSDFILGNTEVYSYSFDLNSSNSNIAKNSSNVVILNGAVLQSYDGNICTELGFHLFPEITNLTEAGAGGSIPNGTYSYLAVYQWTDAKGNLHQSAPSLAKSITCSAGTGTSTVTVSTTANFLTKKPNSSLALYRTTNGGTVYYQVNTFPSGTNADPTQSAAYFTFTDTLSDTNLQKNAQAYTYPGSSVLENSTPPPSSIIVSHNNRLWFVDSENQNTIWYTKSFQDLVGISPSAFLTQQIDPKFGNIAALGEMDANLVIGKEQGFVIQAGDGANDTGTGSTLSFPQFIPSDVGVSQLKSMITTPKGVMFKSTNGIYMLTRSTDIIYIGAEVEVYNSQTITGANLVPGKSQIRFLCSSGLALVYDYIFNQWSTFTAHTGVSSSTWNNTYVYSNGTNVFQEASGVYTDNGSAFSLLAQTSWLALAGVQGFQRVKRLIVLGDFVNGNSASHNLSIAAAYDFSTTFQTAITYAFGAISASGVFQYRERLPIQKCDAISLLIQETTTGSSAEYIDLTNISFEAGVKKGFNKLRGQQSVG